MLLTKGAKTIGKEMVEISREDLEEISKGLKAIKHQVSKAGKMLDELSDAYEEERRRGGRE